MAKVTHENLHLFTYVEIWVQEKKLKTIKKDRPEA